MSDLQELQQLCSEFTLLYAEDEELIRDSMSQYFRKFFAKVTVVKDGKEALELFKIDSYDLVVTDISMPHIDGLEFIEKIKFLKPEQAILITTAHNESEYFMKVIALGIDGYIIKPFQFGQLNEELKKIVGKLHVYRQNEEYKKSLESMVALKSKELNNLLEYEHENYEKTLYSMVDMIEARDTYTAGHSKRVADYSQAIAKEMGYEVEVQEKIYQAGILHDIGKVATPDSVLLNPKRLNEIEYKLI